MNQQYAFAIAFEQQSVADNGTSDPQCSDWQQLISQIKEALESEGFPDLKHPRWDEFGDGHIFWGTKTECDSLKSVLSRVPVALYEERNLHAGYYTDPEGTYYVNHDGDIFGIAHQTNSNSIVEIEPLWTIPLNAYKTQVIAPELEAAFQQAIATTSDESLTLNKSKPVELFEQQLETSSDQIEALEAQLSPEGDDNFLEALTPATDESLIDLTSESGDQTDALLDAPFDLDALTADLSLELGDEFQAVSTEAPDVALSSTTEELQAIEDETADDVLSSIEALETDMSLDLDQDALDSTPSASEDIEIENLAELDETEDELPDAPFNLEALTSDINAEFEDDALESSDESLFAVSEESVDESLDTPFALDALAADMNAETTDESVEAVSSNLDQLLVENTADGNESVEEPSDELFGSIDTLETEMISDVESGVLDAATPISDDSIVEMSDEADEMLNESSDSAPNLLEDLEMDLTLDSEADELFDANLPMDDEALTPALNETPDEMVNESSDAEPNLLENLEMDLNLDSAVEESFDSSLPTDDEAFTAATPEINETVGESSEASLAPMEALDADMSADDLENGLLEAMAPTLEETVSEEEATESLVDEPLDAMPNLVENVEAESDLGSDDESLEATLPSSDDLVSAPMSDMNAVEPQLEIESLEVAPDDYAEMQQLSVQQSQTIETLEQQLEEANRAVNAKIDPVIFSELQREKNNQSTVIQNLEQQIASLSDELLEAKNNAVVGIASEDHEAVIQNLEQQIASLNDEVLEAKNNAVVGIPPEEHEAVKAELSGLTQEIQSLEQAQQQLMAEVENWTQIANSKVDLETYDKLSQTNQEQSHQLTEYRQEIDNLKQELSQWESSSSDKVERQDYEDALKEIQHLRTKLSRSWFARVKDWFRNR